MRLSPGLGLHPGGNGAPALDLNFVNGEALDSSIIFTRGSSATRVNSSGVIESVSSNVARFDYDPSTLAARGLLIEEQRTNLLLRSSEFDNASWAKAQLTITANDIIAPDGSMTGDRLSTTGTTNPTLSADATGGGSAFGNTFSVYVKKGSGAGAGNAFYLRNVTTATNVSSALLNLDTGAVTSSFGNIRVADAGNGWWRISLSTTAGISAGDTLRCYVCYPGSNESLGEYVYAWGAQLEAGMFPTSYIPTAASQVTRSADLASMTGSTFASWYNQTEGTFLAAFDCAGQQGLSGSNEAWTAWQSTNDFISLFANTTDGARDEVRIAGVAQASFNTTALTAGTVYKDAFAYKANDFARSFNGGAVATDTAGSLPTPTILYLGAFQSNSSFLNGHLRTLRYYRTRLPNDALVGLAT